MTSAAVAALEANTYDGLKQTFQRVLGHEPSQAQLENLLRLRDALQLRYDDPLLLQLIAMEHYKAFFEEIPQHMEKASNALLREFQARLQTQMDAAQKEIEKQRAAAAASLTGVATAAVNSACITVGTKASEEAKSATKSAIASALSSLTYSIDQTKSQLEEASSLFRHQFLWFAVLILAGIGLGALCAGFGYSWYLSSSPESAIHHLSRHDQGLYYSGKLLDENWDKLDPKTKAAVNKALGTHWK